MKQKTISALILAAVILAAALGFVWLYSAPESEGQAVQRQTRQIIISPQRTTVPLVTQYRPPAPATQPSSCGTCRKWSACGFNVDQLMVNGQGTGCIDAYKAASQGIPYCGKNAAMQACDPYGQMRHTCVCR